MAPLILSFVRLGLGGAWATRALAIKPAFFFIATGFESAFFLEATFFFEVRLRGVRHDFAPSLENGLAPSREKGFLACAVFIAPFFTWAVLTSTFFTRSIFCPFFFEFRLHDVRQILHHL